MSNKSNYVTMYDVCKSGAKILLVEERVNVFVVGCEDSDEYKALIRLINERNASEFIVTTIDLEHIEDYVQDMEMLTSVNFLTMMTFTNKTNITILIGHVLQLFVENSSYIDELSKMLLLCASLFVEKKESKNKFIIQKHRQLKLTSDNNTVTLDQIFKGGEVNDTK